MKSAIFMINKECNQECKFCLNNFEDEKELSYEEKTKVLDNLKKNGVENITFSGGEPLISKDFLRLVDYAYYKNGFKILIQTNGTLLNKEIFERIKGKVFALEISLEGLESEHNILVGKLNFRKVVKNIKLANKYGMTVFTNFTINKINLACLENYVELIDELNVKVANFTKLYLAGNALNNLNIKPNEKDYDNFLQRLAKIKSKVVINVQAGFDEELLKKHNIKNYATCAIGKEITITPNGSMRLCPSWPKSLGNALYSQLDFIQIETGNDCIVNRLAEEKCISLIQE